MLSFGDECLECPQTLNPSPNRVVQRGLMKSEHVLPSAAVQTYGRDTVVSRTAQDLITAKEWQRSKP